MRLSSVEVKHIKEQLLALDHNAQIYLFGSRTDDKKRGGDIDVLVISSTLSLEDKIKARVALYDRIGEQRIDITIAKSENESAFVEHAINTGIKL